MAVTSLRITVRANQAWLQSIRTIPVVFQSRRLLRRLSLDTRLQIMKKLNLVGRDNTTLSFLLVARIEHLLQCIWRFVHAPPLTKGSHTETLRFKPVIGSRKQIDHSSFSKFSGKGSCIHLSQAKRAMQLQGSRCKANIFCYSARSPVNCHTITFPSLPEE